MSDDISGAVFSKEACAFGEESFGEKATDTTIKNVELCFVGLSAFSEESWLS